MLGLFLVIVGSFGFGAYSLEKAHDICAPEPITKECFVEAVSPIEPVDYSKMND